jgi:hypothetical protein
VVFHSHIFLLYKLMIVFKKWICSKWILGTNGDISVCIATMLRAGQRGAIPGTDRRFLPSPQCPNRIWGPLSLLYEEYWGLCLRGLCDLILKLNTHFYLVSSLRMRGAIYLLLYVFVAWSLIKQRVNYTFCKTSVLLHWSMLIRVRSIGQVTYSGKSRVRFQIR